jgi:hypothetical protein
MNEYTLYFSLYGKKMKTTVSASSEQEAKQIVRDKIVFHKIETNDIFQDLMDIVNGKK